MEALWCCQKDRLTDQCHRMDGMKTSPWTYVPLTFTQSAKTINARVFSITSADTPRNPLSKEWTTKILLSGSSILASKLKRCTIKLSGEILGYVFETFSRQWLWDTTEKAQEEKLRQIGCHQNVTLLHRQNSYSSKSTSQSSNQSMNKNEPPHTPTHTKEKNNWALDLDRHWSKKVHGWRISQWEDAQRC